MNKFLKDRYIREIAALVILLTVYNIGGELWNLSWLPSHKNFPLTDMMVDKSIFFVIVILSTIRFQVKGGIIATIFGVAFMFLWRFFQNSTLDVWLQLLTSGILGIAIAILVGAYISSQEKLKKAHAEVKTLSGFIPICASCKKIRDDKGYWEAVEQYIKEHSSAEFTHGICPECLVKLYANTDTNPSGASNDR